MRRLVGRVPLGNGLAGSVVGLSSAPSRARTSEEDATSADGLTEGGGSGPSQRCTGRLFLHASHKRSADTPLTLHSEVLRFRPIDSEVAQRPQPRENFSHGTSESVRFLQNQAIPGVIPKGAQNCGLPPETVSEHIPQLSCSVLARKAVFF